MPDHLRSLALIFDAPDPLAPGYDAWVEAYDREAAAIQADMARPLSPIDAAAWLDSLGLHDEAARFLRRVRLAA